ncbi:MAG: DUF1009 domain-containing protein, partial [Deltaproteobacteria bacterium]|nr:DUF1009 domain-containing protein [Deltaproteobacteria bacterium]
MSKAPIIALIAGNLSLPLLVAQNVKKKGGFLVVAGLVGETGLALKKIADVYKEFKLGQLGPMADFFLANGAKKLCLAGGVDRRNVIEGYEPDVEAIKVMEKLQSFQTDSILRAVGGYFEDLGLKVVSAVDLVPELTVKEGLLTKKAPEGEIL